MRWDMKQKERLRVPFIFGGGISWSIPLGIHWITTTIIISFLWKENVPIDGVSELWIEVHFWSWIEVIHFYHLGVESLARIGELIGDCIEASGGGSLNDACLVVDGELRVGVISRRPTATPVCAPRVLKVCGGGWAVQPLCPTTTASLVSCRGCFRVVYPKVGEDKVNDGDDEAWYWYSHRVDEVHDHTRHVVRRHHQSTVHFAVVAAEVRALLAELLHKVAADDDGWVAAALHVREEVSSGVVPEWLLTAPVTRGGLLHLRCPLLTHAAVLVWLEVHDAAATTANTTTRPNCTSTTQVGQEWGGSPISSLNAHHVGFDPAAASVHGVFRRVVESAYQVFEVRRHGELGTRHVSEAIYATHNACTVVRVNDSTTTNTDTTTKTIPIQ